MESFCQIIAFIGTIGLISRWIAVGLVSLDRFCRVFWPFVYQRHETKIIIYLLSSSWAVAISVSIVMWLSKTFAFNIAVPGCLFSEAPDMDKLHAFAIGIGFLVCLILGLILPTILYTIMYCKARQIHKKTPVVADTPDNAASAREAQRKANRGTLIYVLMMIVFIGVNVLIVGNIFVRVNLQKNLSTILIEFWFHIRSYVLGDVAIIFTNKQQRDAVKKLIKKWKTHQ